MSVLANPSNFENCAFSYFRKSSLHFPSEMLIFISDFRFTEFVLYLCEPNCVTEYDLAIIKTHAN